MIEINYNSLAEMDQLLIDNEAEGNHIAEVHRNVDGVSGFLKFRDPAEYSVQNIKDTKALLNRIDRYQFRILEELIKLLISNGTIQITDIPQKYRDLYQERQNLWNIVGE